MNKQQISISELAQRIVLERKFNKMVAEVTRAMQLNTKMLNENLPSGIDQAVLNVSKKVDAAGEDVADKNVQAAMLLAALEKGGNLTKITPDDVEQNMPTVKEKKQTLQEAASATLLLVEYIGLILGNAALVVEICGVIERFTGKAINPSKFKQNALKIAAMIKKITEFPMKAFGQAVAWIIKKLGGGKAAQTLGKYSVKVVVVVTLLTIGLTFFPVAGTSILGVTLSVLGVIGKTMELGRLVAGLFDALDKVLGLDNIAPSTS